MRPLPVLLCVDVEPDEFFIDHDRPLPWRGFEIAAEWAGTVRRTLANSHTPPAFTWMLRMDHQVAEVYGRADWAAREYREHWSRFLASGDEVGLHAHAYRWDSGARVWIIDHGNQSWVEQCLQMSFEAFAQAFGRPCVTFRAGDRWMNQATIEWLQRNGVRFDLTVEPGHPPLLSYHPTEAFTGSLPDYRGVPTSPYRPADGDFRREATDTTGPLWIVPMTSAAVQPRWLRRLYYRWFQPARHGVWTAMLSHDPVLFERIIAAALHNPATTHLALPVRSDVFASPRLVKRVNRNIETLVRIGRERPLGWMTADRLIDSCA